MEEGKIANNRELFSELFENPIHPLFIHMVPPFVDENQRMLHLQLSGEALWKWRDVCAPGTLFELLRASILPLGCQLHDSACERVGDVIAQSVRRFREKLQSCTNGKKRRKLKAETWIKLGIKAEEIKQTPNDVLAQLNQANDNLPATVVKSAELYAEMRDSSLERARYNPLCLYILQTKARDFAIFEEI